MLSSFAISRRHVSASLGHRVFRRSMASVTSLQERYDGEEYASLHLCLYSSQTQYVLLVEVTQDVKQQLVPHAPELKLCCSPKTSTQSVNCHVIHLWEVSERAHCLERLTRWMAFVGKFQVRGPSLGTLLLMFVYRQSRDTIPDPQSVKRCCCMGMWLLLNCKN